MIDVAAMPAPSAGGRTRLRRIAAAVKAASGALVPAARTAA
jgi:hypothetical protein